jgi:hypothetical protein
MRAEIEGRVVLRCNRCNARYEMGPVNRDPLRPERSPSGWLSMDNNKHLCSMCSPAALTGFQRRY